MSVSNLSATQTNKGIKFGQSKKSGSDFKTIDTKYFKYNKRYFCCTENVFCVITMCLSSFYTKQINKQLIGHLGRSQQLRGLRRRSTVARLLRSWVRIPPGAWMFVCCECCVLSGRGLCDGLIIRSEESYRMWRVAVCDQVTSYARRLKPDRGL